MAFPDAPEMRQMGAGICRNTTDFPNGLRVRYLGWGRIGVWFIDAVVLALLTNFNP